MDDDESDSAAQAVIEEDEDLPRSEDERDQEEMDAEKPESDDDLLTAPPAEAERRMVDEVRYVFHKPLDAGLTLISSVSALGQANGCSAS